MRYADVRLVIGTRPEAIKLAPVAHALAARGVTPRLILTGQHPGLDPPTFALGDYPCTDLRCRGRENPRDYSVAVAIRLADHLAERPALVIVQGDTSSALGGALAGSAMHIPVAHVEAGLRTHDPTSPWPEEEFRVAIDSRADLLFAPTELSAANLRRESVRGAIHVTGNSGIDAVLAAAAELVPGERQASRRRLLVTCHRRESWGEGLRSIAAALVALAGDAQIDFVLHPNPAVAAAMRRALADCPAIQVHPPCAHADLLRMMLSATLTLSDSGGMQEEAAALGAPLLVLRDKTERPEAIATGNMILVGTDSFRIVAEARRLLRDQVALAAMARPAFPYGDGRSAPRIARIITDWLDQRKRGASRLRNAPQSDAEVSDQN
ncbi:MAG TPA: UDP-N-acetylglucosamine 2-epimerase (non-hydrolyzing) [Sphingomicrobium sp.]|nr:UDP-N-acetylglucosamine 2-epimerase (non-hydrolyzing) [Sphingomicrobium sp.]